MNLKYPHLSKTLGTIIQEIFLTLYPSEPFRMWHFEMRYPVEAHADFFQIVYERVTLMEKVDFQFIKTRYYLLLYGNQK